MPFKLCTTRVIASDALEKQLISLVCCRVKFLEQPANVALVFIEERLLEVGSCQVLLVVRESEVNLRRRQLAPVLFDLASPEEARILHLILPLLVDHHLLMRLQVHHFRYEVSEPDSIEEGMKVQLFVQTRVSIFEKFLAAFTLLEALTAL